MEILPFLLAPFVASLILTGIHAYLGVHVVERGVIFVDLALAQIAALGATVAVVVGMDPHGRAAYWISLAFTFLGAGIFAFARSSRGHIPQEAFIGIAYAVASATAILLMSKATGETEHLKDMLVGNILAVSWPEVRKTAILYGVIGIFHFLFRKRFLAISMNHGKAEKSGVNVRFLDFLFYGHAFRGPHWLAPRHRLDHGHFGFGARLLSQRGSRYAHWRHHRGHFRWHPGVDVLCAPHRAPWPLRP